MPTPLAVTDPNDDVPTTAVGPPSLPAPPPAPPVGPPTMMATTAEGRRVLVGGGERGGGGSASPSPLCSLEHRRRSPSPYHNTLPSHHHYGGTSTTVGGPPGPPPPMNTNMMMTSTHMSTMRPPPSSSSYSNVAPPMDDLGGQKVNSSGCTCKKSRCLKLYCQCFAQSTTCGPKCRCQDCNNNPNYVREIQTARDIILERNPTAFEDKFRRGPSRTTVGPPMPPPPPPPPHPLPMWTTTGGSPAPSSSGSSSSLRHPLQHVVDMNGYPKTTTYYTTHEGRHYEHHVAEQHQGHVLGSHNPFMVSRSRENASGCKCRKSFCLKKYCECFQNQVYCGSNCRCSNCKNFPPPPGPGGNHPSSAATAAAIASSSPPSIHHHRHHGPSFSHMTTQIMHPATASGPHAFSRPMASSMGGTHHGDSGLQHSVLPSGRYAASASSSPNGFISRPVYSPHDIHQARLDDFRRDAGGQKQDEDRPSKAKMSKSGDALAIMAAVAMAELGSKSPRKVSLDNKATRVNEVKQVKEKTAKSGGVEKEGSGEKRRSVHDNDADAVAISPETALDEQQDKKRRRPNDLESPVRPLESRNPSPVSVHESPDQQRKKQIHPAVQLASTPTHASLGCGHRNENETSVGSPTMMNTPHHHHSSYPPYAVVHSYGPSGPSTVSPTYGKPLSTSRLPPDPSMPPMSYPPTSHDRFGPRASLPPPSVFHHNRLGMVQWAPRSSEPQGSYGLVTQTKGLPKSLSFRKICSKCGKTRAEHADCGFGNKCQFTTCGKCGASVEAHTKASVTMGVLCELTVDQGAQKGAAEKYRKQIQGLAERAEIQKSLQEDHRQRESHPFHQDVAIQHGHVAPVTAAMEHAASFRP